MANLNKLDNYLHSFCLKSPTLLTGLSINSQQVSTLQTKTLTIAIGGGGGGLSINYGIFYTIFSKVLCQLSLLLFSTMYTECGIPAE